MILLEPHSSFISLSTPLVLSFMTSCLPLYFLAILLHRYGSHGMTQLQKNSLLSVQTGYDERVRNIYFLVPTSHDWSSFVLRVQNLWDMEKAMSTPRHHNNQLGFLGWPLPQHCIGPFGGWPPLLSALHQPLWLVVSSSTSR